MKLEQYMRVAINEAEASLREGNNGFGAVIVKDGNIVVSTHDTEDTDNDSTSHAEINAIRSASKILGKNLLGCVLISTHEPCPMCAFAIVWSGISEVAYGHSIQDSIDQGRKRINFSCAEVFNKAGADVHIYEKVLEAECSILYRKDVRKEIENLRNSDDEALSELNNDSVCRRTRWFQENVGSFDFISEDLLDSGYRLLLERFQITENEAPIKQKTDREIVFYSMNFCPTLEACKILQIDTRNVCRKMNEHSTDSLLKQISSKLKFSRNYDKLRPYTEYCEEMISLASDE